MLEKIMSAPVLMFAHAGFEFMRGLPEFDAQ
jgi:hypothetical protein